MIKALVIDDEPLARTVIKEYLEDNPAIEIVAECNDGFEGIKAIQQHQPDLIFLDVQMPKINGFEMLELVEHVPAVIFTTAFDEYALKAFEAHAVDYLLKPFSKERFEKGIAKFHDLEIAKQQKINTGRLLADVIPATTASERIVVKNGGKIRIIPVDQVHYLEAADDYVKIHVQQENFLKNKTMGYFESTLPAARFVRVHRSFIINVQEITRIDPYEKDGHLAVLRSGAKVPVSKSGYVKLKEVLGL